MTIYDDTYEQLKVVITPVKSMVSGSVSCQSQFPQRVYQNRDFDFKKGKRIDVG